MSDILKLEGIMISYPTIQNILNKNNLGSRFERLLRLEEKTLKNEIELTPEQVTKIEKANPRFRKRHVESKRPGELLSQERALKINAVLTDNGREFCGKDT